MQVKLSHSMNSTIIRRITNHLTVRGNLISLVKNFTLRLHVTECLVYRHASYWKSARSMALLKSVHARRADKGMNSWKLLHSDSEHRETGRESDLSLSRSSIAKGIVFHVF